tara:strand:- start:172 stop:633 length:462 start_codon:yes stop_codon:yes gene_type:complete
MGKLKIPKKFQITFILFAVPFLTYFYYTRIYLPEASTPIGEINAEILFDDGVYTVINNDDFEWKWLTISVFVPGVLERGNYTEKYSLVQGDSIILDDNELRNFSRSMGGGLRGYLQKDAKIKSYSLSGKYKVDGKLFKIKKINWENEAYVEDN